MFSLPLLSLWGQLMDSRQQKGTHLSLYSPSECYLSVCVHHIPLTHAKENMNCFFHFYKVFFMNVELFLSMDMHQGLKAQVIILDLPQSLTSYNSTAAQSHWDGESVFINLLRFQHLFLLVHSESAYSEVPD